uniref:Cap-specific mRNA (nucleoside-2'-O-)-methyltransferase 1 n=1 Tax=Nothobranchius rachovii TaxID=451742 RepID=A0A1A8NGL2_9TELE
MRRRADAPLASLQGTKRHREKSSSDEESQSRQDSSQNDSLSDQEDHRPGFSMPSISSPSFDAQDNDDSSQASSKFTMYNSVSQRLMAKMGFREGEGLGKFGQGRKEIVEASTQRGRRGLGLTLQGFQGELNVDWRDEPEPSATEKVEWFPECTTEIPDADELRDWMVVGQRKLKIEDETEFCTEDLLHTLLRCKTVFDSLDGEEMRRARTRSNPYETIRGGIFLNRAAMKMSNIDHCFDNMFTNPKDSNGSPLTKDREDELLYFGDVCAGPGGFSEYILWKRRWHAKGFGMTLKGPCDFKLEDFYAAPSELFEPYYGEGGVDGDGDITRPENVTAFRNFVMESTERRGLHFLMADGGFSVEGQENIQEILSKQLLLCQFLTAISTIRTGGHFVCKTFDLFTPFSVGLVYLLYLCFDRISLFKPVTSRPANSERYVVCRGLKPGSDAVREYMFRVNLKLNQVRNSDRDVTDVVPLHIIKDDPDFYQFMVNSNESLCAVQIKALAKIHAFVVEPTLSEPRQANIRKECLKLWGVPDKARVAPPHSDPRTKFYELIKNPDVELLQSKLTPLNSSALVKLRQIFDYSAQHQTAGAALKLQASYTGRDDRHFLPSGLYIIKTFNEPWTMAYSKNSNKKYFFNKLTQKSTYAMPPDAAAPFHVCHSERFFWAWVEGVIVHDSQTRMDPEKLSKEDFLSFIHQHYQH